MTNIFFTMALATTAYISWKSYKKRSEQNKNQKQQQLTDEELHEWLAKNRLCKLEEHKHGNVHLRFLKIDRINPWDSNIKRWSSPFLDSSWGFSGTGPHIMAEDILYHFTGNERFSKWGKPVEALVLEQIRHVPFEKDGMIKSEAIQEIISRYWNEFEEESRHFKKEGQLCS